MHNGSVWRVGGGVRRVEAVLGRLPEVAEVDWRGNRTFMVGKRSFLGLDEGGLACRSDKDERPALVQRPWYTPPPFVATRRPPRSWSTSPRTPGTTWP